MRGLLKRVRLRGGPPIGRRFGGALGVLLAIPILLGSGPEVRRAQVVGEASFRLVMVPPGTPSGSAARLIQYDERFAERPGWKVYESDSLRVEWPVELNAGDGRMAERLDRAFHGAWSRSGIRPRQKVLLQIQAVEAWPAALVLESHWRPPAESPYLPVALPALPEGAVLSEELEGLRLPSELIFLLGHELTEYMLVTRERGTLLMDTVEAEGEAEAHSTRWFREGFATAVSVAICEELGLAHSFSRTRGAMALSELGARVLFWAQYQDQDAETTHLYYDASYELVSRIFDVAGPGGVEAFILDFARYDFLDGPRLGDLTLEHFGRRPLEFLGSEPSGGGGVRDDGAAPPAD